MQARRLNWQDEDKNLAPLSETQLDILYDVLSYINVRYNDKGVSKHFIN